jgi:hypothetical protein
MMAAEGRAECEDDPLHERLGRFGDEHAGGLGTPESPHPSLAAPAHGGTVPQLERGSTT